MPKAFAETVQAPFIHRHLLLNGETPLPPLPAEDALSCLKNPHNQVPVFYNPEGKAYQPIADIADPLRLSPPGLLAALHALLLAQMVRLFDGAIRLRAQAEADETMLLAYSTFISGLKIGYLDLNSDGFECESRSSMLLV
ncbi:GsfR2 [Macrophomina phaseolina MS6]|uniref:GsfR2 n=1 Tax=Macrophomina phaseolina (strain MS6) TaxID=1126212 RepID=K2R580_MACPH|nr:GsfR2 [Macrophomina phaseolina MS6]